MKQACHRAAAFRETVREPVTTTGLFLKPRQRARLPSPGAQLQDKLLAHQGTQSRVGSLHKGLWRVGVKGTGVERLFVEILL